MIARKLRLTFAAASLALALPAVSQVGHPVKGAWSGYWGPNDDERHRILLSMDWVTHGWEDNELVGTINPGRDAVELDNVELDLDTWTLTLQADLPHDNGKTERWTATGRLENLGSWTNRTYRGTYRHGDERGTIELSLN